MTLPHFALKYEACSYKELRRFIRDRTGRDVIHSTNKGKLISSLRSLDKNASFHFEDLPPEPRILVYEYLLTYNTKNRSEVYIAVLRTSKEIYREAQDVFMAESIIPLSIDFYKTWTRVRAFKKPWPILGSFRGNLATSCQGAMKFRSADALGDFASFYAAQIRPITYARTIHIDLTIGQGSRPGRFHRIVGDVWAGDLALSFLKTLISTCRHLRYLKLNITTEFRGQSAREERGILLQVLRPLGELSPAKITLDLQGLPDATYDKFWRTARASSALKESDTAEQEQETSLTSIDGDSG